MRIARNSSHCHCERSDEAISSLSRRTNRIPTPGSLWCTSQWQNFSGHRQGLGTAAPSSSNTWAGNRGRTLEAPLPYPPGMMHRPSLGVALVAGALAASGAFCVPTPPPTLDLRRATGAIAIDGDLDSYPGGKARRASRGSTETTRGDNVEPPVRTVALVAVRRSLLLRRPHLRRSRAREDPGAVREPGRDHRRRSRQRRRVPRHPGRQALRDGVRQPAGATDGRHLRRRHRQARTSTDFFFYDTAARITPRGWQAEIRDSVFDAAIRPRQTAQLGDHGLAQASRATIATRSTATRCRGTPAARSATRWRSRGSRDCPPAGTP